jgi:uncharacterized membrane protein
MAQAPGSGGKGTGLAPNIASMLSYICMPISSIIFMMMEKENKDVQFHAWQGTVFGVAYVVLMVVIQILASILGAAVSFLGMILGILMPIVGLVALVVWVICLIKAYQGERWKIPYIGDFAAKKAGVA